uniref:Bromo domain-containing protein n=1 Tax=Chenopodium quinoa TaxID=63459 RepID=A0A803L3L5_CHEQI
MSRRGGQKRRVNFGDGERRRSPRLFGSISASSQKGSNIKASRETTSKHHHRLPPSCDSDHDQDDDNKLDSHSRSCAKLELKQSLKIPRPLNSHDQGERAPSHRDDHSKDDESWLPDKSSLELVLDTLQRRDTYDIFAEPVDPSEVEEYYEIIKEPMDFGTMRAKLHEGMYKNIQQFEHDVYLIFGNAMHFNSSSTVYFRQARALEDLAKNIFFVLKKDPKNFKMDFTAIRRRSSRKFGGEHSGLTFGSSGKLARDLGSNSMHTDLGRKGFGKERKTSFSGIDRRSTYKSWICLFDETSSAVSPLFCGTKPLIPENLEESGYKESLMLFARNLGPTAHRVAKNKLQGLWMQSSSSSRSQMNSWDNSSVHNSQAPAASSLVQKEPANSLLCGTIPSTNLAASHRVIDIETANDIRKTSDVSTSGEKSAKSFVDIKSIIPCTSLGTSDCVLRDQAQGNMKYNKSISAIASGDKLKQKISVNQYGELDVMTHTSSKDNENTEFARPRVLLKDGGTLSCHLNTMLPAVKETILEQFQAGNNFDLNQVQVIPSPSYLVGCSYEDDNLETREVKSYSGLVEATKFNHLSSTGHAKAAIYEDVTNMHPSSISSQFNFNLPYLKLSMGKLGDEVFENSSTTNGQRSALQLPPELNSSSLSPNASKISFGKASGGYTNHNHGFYLENHHMTSPYIMKTQLPKLYT